jgi:hypothetical protein
MWLDASDEKHVDPVSDWLAPQREHQWLDYGPGVEELNKIPLQIMIQRRAWSARVPAGWFKAGNRSLLNLLSC